MKVGVAYHGVLFILNFIEVTDGTKIIMWGHTCTRRTHICTHARTRAHTHTLSEA